jgi:serine protease AprX
MSEDVSQQTAAVIEEIAPRVVRRGVIQNLRRGLSAGVADLFQANPALTPDQVKALIMHTSYKTFLASSTSTDPVSGNAYVSYYDIFTVRAGYLDLQAAFQNISSLPTGLTAMSPTAVYDSGSGQVTLSPNTSSRLWAMQAVWNLQSVYGSTNVSGTRAVWGKQAVWGKVADFGENILTGTCGVWGKTGVAASGAVSSSKTDASEALTIAIQGEP